MSKLLLIPTPIGNLEDITLRAVSLLKKINILLAEDTRTTKKLLRKYNITTKVISFHSHNEHSTLEKWIKKLESGFFIGLVSDAGTPGISDPGFLLIREAIKKNIDVECLPGPTAFLPALIISGIPCNSFVFEGFLPVKKGRNKKLKKLSKETRTMIFYESPHRIIKTLKLFIEFFGEERYSSISRELTKIFEETKRGSLKELLEYFKDKKPKGEFVIIISGEA